MNKKWTPAEEAFIVDERKAGKTVLEIANETGRSVKSLYNKFNRLKVLDIPRWSFRDEQSLIDYKNVGKSEIEIAELLNKTVKSINNKTNELVSDGRLLTKTQLFDITKDSIIIDLRQAGYNSSFIADYLGCSKRMIEKRISFLLASNLINRKNKIWSDEELLNAVETYKTCDNLFEAASFNKTLPYPQRVFSRFGSWNIAKLILGLELSKVGLKPEMDTILYLIKFKDFYKVGITQRTIKQRFIFGYEEYKIIDSIILDLEAALESEKELLEIVKPYKFEPINFKGYSECFKTNVELKELGDIYVL